ncbi:MAG: hypothetical protein KDK66_07905, partial [Deltaproteobacteria bacterium]|nr:hypothetical protein [Deltaproteobacteria bacterium]
MTSSSNIAILGLGIVGQSLAKYFSQQNYSVWGLDDGDLNRFKSKPYFTQLISPQDFKDYSKLKRFFVSPGVPLNHPSLLQAKNFGLKIENELDLAYELQQKNNPSAKLIAITGTNGKSTTTCLIGEILKKAGHKT